MPDRKKAKAASDKLARVGSSGLDLETFRVRTFDAIHQVVPFDAAFWTIADPATLLFTRGVQDEIPPETAPAFLQNEFMTEDVNQFAAVAAAPRGMHTMHAATGGDMSKSARFREILEPLGLGDELRIAFTDKTGVWGFVCIHRQLGAPPFSEQESAFLNRVSPIVAHGIRTSILLAASQMQGEHPSVPGLVMLSEDLKYVGANDAGRTWLDRFDDADKVGGIPSSFYVVAAALRGMPSGEPPRTRTLTPSGWASVHPSWMDISGERHIALLIEEPSTVELAPLIVSAYGLTPQQSRVVELVCRGSSTADISSELTISPHTVQDHMKAIFKKMGASNRRELVASLLSSHYMPRAMAEEPINRRGQFDR
jgi:DNA-binding CsgD family transcriptional regulator